MLEGGCWKAEVKIKKGRMQKSGGFDIKDPFPYNNIDLLLSHSELLPHLNAKNNKFEQSQNCPYRL
jgi:hypothetical protein